MKGSNANVGIKSQVCDRNQQISNQVNLSFPFIFFSEVVTLIVVKRVNIY